MALEQATTRHIMVMAEDRVLGFEEQGRTWLRILISRLLSGL
jgi:hypothetical protein